MTSPMMSALTFALSIEDTYPRMSTLVRKWIADPQETEDLLAPTLCKDSRYGFSGPEGALLSFLSEKGPQTVPQMVSHLASLGYDSRLMLSGIHNRMSALRKFFYNSSQKVMLHRVTGRTYGLVYGEEADAAKALYFARTIEGGSPKAEATREAHQRRDRELRGATSLRDEAN